ncbi:MAG: YggT family protein [Chloroflexi bacterium HGW-Chloroflexi-4]|jgi:YggT family protein|nr:MAG: YggT family protein [Chloroflexi bacterium HGW-Chloroflexi-4]
MTSVYVVVRTLFDILSFAVIIDSVVSFILPPFHPVRSFLDRLVQPLLNPFRRIIPPIGGLDLSPIALLLLIQLVETLILRLLL